jgi:ABC-type antimicrobial peptide transport system permease subunit
MGLPFDYAVKNLGRRRLRTALTAGSSAIVAALLVATTAFVRGLEQTFGGAASDETALLLSSASQRDVVRSAVDAGLGELVAASVRGIEAASDEIHMGTKVFVDGVESAGFVRGVTPSAYAVHDALTLVEGRLPAAGEVIAGRLVVSQLDVPEERLALGRTLRFEGTDFEIVGRFAAPGTTLEAELWTPLEPLRGLTQRHDSSVTFVRFSDPETLDRLELFTRRRLDLELLLIPSAVYYAELTAYFAPIQRMAWALAAMIAAAALFGGANTVNAAVQDRLRELATLRAVGYSGIAIVRSLAQESVLLAALGGIVGLLLARVALAGGAVRLAMSAFSLRVDAVAILVGFGSALLLGLLGAAPAALRLVRLPIALALKEE